MQNYRVVVRGPRGNPVRIMRPVRGVVGSKQISRNQARQSAETFRRHVRYGLIGQRGIAY
jgi:hypothetical protein